MKDNKGYSLVELIAVITIIILLSSIGIIGVTLGSGKPAGECISNLKVMVINDRTMAMGKYKTELTITADATGVYATEQVWTDATNSDTTTKQIGKKGVELAYSADGTTYSAIPTGGIKMEFDRASGALKSPTNDMYFKATKAGYDYKMTIFHFTGKIVTE